MYEHPANARDEATLAVKLNAHGEAVYERHANTRDEATLAAKLNACSEAAYKRKLHTRQATLERVSCKALNTKLTSWQS